MEIRLWMLAGIGGGLVVGLVLVMVLFNKKVLDSHFDERQERARGKAFQYAFFTLLVCLFGYGVSDLALGRWCDPLAGVTLCMAISICVLAVACILKDAYLSLYEKPRQVMTMFALIAAVNLGLGGLYLWSGELVEDGVLTYRAVNPILGVMVLIVLIAYLVNHLLRTPEDAE